MDKKYTYEVVENGYFILIDGVKSIHQYEPYILNKNLSYKENAKEQIKEMRTGEYADEVINKKITIEDVPEELKEAVEKSIEIHNSRKLNEPATKGEITDIQLALAEVYELIVGGAE